MPFDPWTTQSNLGQVLQGKMNNWNVLHSKLAKNGVFPNLLLKHSIFSSVHFLVSRYLKLHRLQVIDQIEAQSPNIQNTSNP